MRDTRARAKSKLHAVGDLLGRVAGVVSERLGRVARLLPALVLKRQRPVPVVERWERLDTRRNQLIHEAVVEVQALGVGLARALRENPRPRNRVCGNRVGFRRFY